jgi:transposase
VRCFSGRGSTPRAGIARGRRQESRSCGGRPDRSATARPENYGAGPGAPGFELLEELDGLWRRLESVEKKLDELAKADPATLLLETTPGVGRRTAEVVAAYLDDAKRFSNGREVSAYSGLVPRQYQSGELDRRGRITRRGPSLLRKLLVEAAWCSLRYNAWARGIVARISRGQRTRKKQAIIALARKLLVRLWAMLRDGVPWRDPGAAAPQAAMAASKT